MTNIILDPASCIGMDDETISAFTCVACDFPLPLYAERILIEGIDSYLCVCGENSYIDDVDVHVIPSSVKFLDAEITRQSVWYHSTTVENWAEVVSEVQAGVSYGVEFMSVPYVHVGTLGAALERFKDKQSDCGWLFEIRLKDDAVLAGEVYEDQNAWEVFVRTGFFEDKQQCDAIRYVNRWESVGSVSLIMDPRCFEVVRVSPLKKEAVLSEDSVLVSF